MMPSTLREEIGAGAGAKRVRVDGVEIAYTDDGMGSVVICTHALAHGARDFEYLRARLAKHMRVLALDWPGHGCSGTDREPVSAWRFAKLLLGFMDALSLTDVVLLGN